MAKTRIYMVWRAWEWQSYRYLRRIADHLLPGLSWSGAIWIAIAMVVYAVWNALNDPIFGQFTTDHAPSWVAVSLSSF
jgi:hypothetical protein